MYKNKLRKVCVFTKKAGSPPIAFDSQKETTHAISNQLFSDLLLEECVRVTHISVVTFEGLHRLYFRNYCVVFRKGGITTIIKILISRFLPHDLLEIC